MHRKFGHAALALQLQQIISGFAERNRRNRRFSAGVWRLHRVVGEGQILDLGAAFARIGDVVPAAAIKTPHKRIVEAADHGGDALGFRHPVGIERHDLNDARLRRGVDLRLTRSKHLWASDLGSDPMPSDSLDWHVDLFGGGDSVGIQHLDGDLSHQRDIDLCLSQPARHKLDVDRSVFTGGKTGPGEEFGSIV